MVEQARLLYEHHEVEWPKWCFLPNDVWRAIGARSSSDPGTGIRGDVIKFSASALLSIPSLQALGTWRYTKGLYRFDKTVYDAVRETPITGKIPSSLLTNLPEWCVYIETPGMFVWENRLFGFFAMIGYDSSDGQAELKILLDTEDKAVTADGEYLLLPLSIHLGDWTIEEGILSMREVSQQRSGVTYRINNRETGEEAPPDSPEFKQILHELVEFLTPLVSLVLYLCAEEKDVSHLGTPQKLKEPEIVVKTKRGPRIFQQDKTTEWDVGVRMGALLRKHLQRLEEEDNAAPDGTGKPRGPMAPHIRRAHWHTYWRGARGSSERSAYVLWLSPILVNIVDVEGMPTTVHPVVP